MRVTNTIGGRRARIAVAAVSIALLLAACGGASGSPRPTDPHLIVTEAVRATAGLPTFRLHVEAASSMDRTVMGGEAGTIQVGMALDADVDLVNRQFAGRQTTTITGGGNDLPMPAGQSSDVIVTNAAVFARQGGAARWTKVGGMGLNAGPTNAQVATALIGLLDDGRVTYDRADAVACTLGTCDHVIVHVNGAAVAAALGALLNTPVDAPAIPDVDLDVRIDQATSVISELRTSMTLGGQSLQLLVTLLNPGDAVQIVAPPPALVDDMLGGGGQVTTILETVGSEMETPAPDWPEESPTAP